MLRRLMGCRASILVHHNAPSIALCRPISDVVVGSVQQQDGVVLPRPLSSSTIVTSLPLANPVVASLKNPFDPLVAIVGGGIGGVGLAVALQQRGIRCVIYERDMSFSQRAQGYGLTMQQGAKVLQQLGLSAHDAADAEDDEKRLALEWKMRGNKSTASDADTTQSPAAVVSSSFSSSSASSMAVSATPSTAASSSVASVVAASNETPNSSGAPSQLLSARPPINGTSSRAHFSFRPDGTLLGAFGRALYSNTGHGSLVVGRAEKGRHNIHLPRQELRHSLLKQVAPENIVWGARLVGLRRATPPPTPLPCKSSAGAEEGEGEDDAGEGGGMVLDASAGGGLVLSFADGSEHPADVVVGADGIYSSVRRFLWNTGGGAESASGSSGNSASGPPLAAVSPTILANSSGDPCPLQYLGLMVVLGRAVCMHPLLRDHVVQVLDGETRIYTMPFTPGELQRQAMPEGSTASKPGDAPAPPTMVKKGDLAAWSVPPVVMWQLSFKISEEDARALHLAGPAALKAEALRRCGTWMDPLPTLLVDTIPEDITGYGAYDRTVLMPDELRPPMMPTAASSNETRSATSSTSSSSSFSLRGPHCRVTLLGDAAHPMSPFKGQGANQALCDAVDLAIAIDASKNQINRMREAEATAAAAAAAAERALVLASSASLSAVASEALAQEAAAQVTRLQMQHSRSLRKEARRLAKKQQAENPKPQNLKTQQIQQQQQYVKFMREESCGDLLADALAAYERLMLSRADLKVMQSRAAAVFLHSQEACVPANCTRVSAARAAAEAAATKGCRNPLPPTLSSGIKGVSLTGEPLPIKKGKLRQIALEKKKKEKEDGEKAARMEVGQITTSAATSADLAAIPPPLDSSGGASSSPPSLSAQQNSTPPDAAHDGGCLFRFPMSAHKVAVESASEEGAFDAQGGASSASSTSGSLLMTGGMCTALATVLSVEEQVGMERMVAALLKGEEVH